MFPNINFKRNTGIDEAGGSQESQETSNDLEILLNKLSLEELRDIKKNIQLCKEKSILQSSLSTIALRFLNSEELVEEKIISLEKKSNQEKLETLEKQKIELEKKYSATEIEYDHLNAESERLDGAGGVNFIQMNQNIAQLYESLNKYSDEITRIEVEMESLKRVL